MKQLIITDKVQKELLKDFMLMGETGGYHRVTDATTLVKSDNQTFFQGNITDITDFVKEKEKRERNGRQ